MYLSPITLVVFATSAIDRAAVLRRNNLKFVHPEGNINPAVEAHSQLTVGNGEIAFTLDHTGLQSFNTSYPGGRTFPLYTMSNWGWHSPSVKGATDILFNKDGELNYTYMNVQINSSDTRPGKGNRTVPYQFNCADYNDAAVCDYEHNFPARINLGHLAFVLPNARGVIEMSDVTKGKVNYGYFDGSCDKIQWNNTFDRSHWCRRSPPGTPAGTCLSPPPPPAPPPPQAAGEYAFLELKEITAAAQELDLMTGSVISNWSYAGEHDVQVVTLTDADTDTVSTRFTAPAAMGLTVQLAFCNLASNGAACTWTPFGDPDGPLDEHYTTVVKNTHAADGKSGRLDVGRRLGLHDTYST
eukprot:gene14153-12567_t